MKNLVVFVVLIFLIPYIYCNENIQTYRAGVYAHRMFQPKETTINVGRKDALKNMLKNLEIYSVVAAQANSQGVQILVFPEDGIYGFDFTRKGIEPYLEYIPNPAKESWNPCHQPDRYKDTEVQRNLSCLASNNSIYIVANMGDNQPCDNTTDPKCPADGHYQFNTNVVYSPNGTLIARYHKTHMYYEDQFDPSPTTEHVFFDTPFGRFGVFTCFDIFFRNPAIDLIENYNISNFVFPAGWDDSPPLYSAIQFHAAFAMGMKINLLAANIQFPEDSFHGSGIYGQEGYLEFYYNENNGTKLLVADVASTPVGSGRTRNQSVIQLHEANNTSTPPRKQSEITSHFTKSTKSVYSRTNIKTLIMDNSDNDNLPVKGNDTVSRTNIISYHKGNNLTTKNNEYKSTSISPATKQIKQPPSSKTFEMGIFNDTYTVKILQNAGDVITVCNNNLCCELDYENMEGSNNLVAFGAFDGLHVYLKTFYLQVCILFTCAGTTTESCNEPTETSDTYFREIRLAGNFTSKYTFPEVLVSDSGRKSLASGDLYDYHDGTLEVFNGLRLPLLSAVLLSRDYDKD